MIVDEKTREWAKKQNIKKVLLFTERGEGSCPLACKYCFLAKQGKRKIMSVQTLHDTIDWLREVAVEKPSLHFFGTEPLMQWDLIVEAKRYAPDMNMSMTTNGYLLTDERIKWINDNHIKIFVYSIDGGPEHNVSRVTVAGKPSWDRVAENLKKLVQTPQVKWLTARGTWAPTDYDLVSRYKALQDLGAKSVVIVPAIDMEGWDEAKVARAYADLADYYDYDTAPSSHIERMIKNISKGADISRRNGCNTGRHAWTVGPEGDLYICQGYEEIPEGRLGSIYEGITNESAFDITFELDNIHLDERYEREDCKTCFARKLCMNSGFCGSQNQLNSGRPVIPTDGYCAHLRGMVSGCRYWLGKRQMKQGLIPKLVGKEEVKQDDICS